jgi:hypothetical protein
VLESFLSERGLEIAHAFGVPAEQETIYNRGDGDTASPLPGTV